MMRAARCETLVLAGEPSVFGEEAGLESIEAAHALFARKHPDFVEELAKARVQALWDPIALHRAPFSTALFDLGVVLRGHQILDGKATIMVGDALGGAFGFDSTALARVFAEYAGRTAYEPAIAWLDGISRTPVAPANLLVAVRGLRLAAEVEIGDWRFIPREGAQQSFDIEHHLIDIDKATFGGACHAIAVCPLGEVPWRFDHTSQQGHDASRRSGALIEQLRMITNAIAYADGGAPSSDRWWAVYVGETFGPFLQPVTTMRDIQSRHPFELTDLTDAGIEAAARHLQFEGAFRKQMDIAARRLASARRRVGDQADTLIDLAIAVESLLGDSNRADFTYKLSLRGGLLLGEDLPARKVIYKAIRELYDARSQVVHGRDCRDVSIIDRGDQLIARLINRIAHTGRMPDWPTLELSGGAAI